MQQESYPSQAEIAKAWQLRAEVLERAEITLRAANQLNAVAALREIHALPVEIGCGFARRRYQLSGIKGWVEVPTDSYLPIQFCEED